MAKRDLRINYSGLDSILTELYKFESALETLRNSVSIMEKNLIENNSGKAVDKLEAQCEIIKKQIEPHEKQVKDLKDLMQNYITEMTDLIKPGNRNEMTQVSRNDVYGNIVSMESKKHEHLSETLRATQSFVGSITFTDNYTEEAQNAFIYNEKAVHRIETDIIEPLKKKISKGIDEIWDIYNSKIKTYENKDDEYAAKARKDLYGKYSSDKEVNDDFDKWNREANEQLGKGLLNKGWNFIKDAGKLVGALGVLSSVGATLHSRESKRAKNTVDDTLGSIWLLLTDPESVIEATAQSTNDSAEKNGWAYMIGGAVPDIVAIALTKRAIGVQVGKSGKDKIPDAKLNTKSTQLCFVAGTSILTETGYKPIESICLGERVLSENTEKKSQSYEKVVQLFSNTTNKIVKITINENIIETTEEHPFYVLNKGWTEAKKLLIGSCLVDKKGSPLLIEALEFKALNKKISVYNLEVENSHTYFVSKLGILVHNDCSINAGKWHKGSFNSPEESLMYHFKKHGEEVGAANVEQYLRKAEVFAENLKRASSKKINYPTADVTRYYKNGKYIDLAPDGTIVSFGKQ